MLDQWKSYLQEPQLQMCAVRFQLSVQRPFHYAGTKASTAVTMKSTILSSEV
jgi:hypothetical protein